MIRIHAPPIAAEMVELQPIGNRTIDVLPIPAMRSYRAIREPKPTVSIPDQSACPIPAFSSQLYVAPEAVNALSTWSTRIANLEDHHGTSIAVFGRVGPLIPILATRHVVTT